MYLKYKYVKTVNYKSNHPISDKITHSNYSNSFFLFSLTIRILNYTTKYMTESTKTSLIAYRQ